MPGKRTNHNGAAPRVDDALELQLVREAIAVVAAGASPCVIVASLRFGRAILEPAARLAADVGLAVSTLETPDPGRVDLVVAGSGVRNQASIGATRGPARARVPRGATA
jgi:hypothetical protein